MDELAEQAELISHQSDSDSENVEFQAVKSEVEDPVLDTIGSFGPYQLYVCCLGFLLTVVHCWLSLSLKFVGLKTGFSCDEGDEVERQGECEAKFGNISRPCTRFSYNVSEVRHTIVQRWDLVCDKAGLENVAQSVFFTGCLVGVFLAGLLADRLGRKTVCIVLVLVFCVVGVAGGLVTNWWVWLCMRFVVGAASIGMVTVRYTIQMEMVGARWRSWANTISGSGWVVGYMTLPVLAYTVPDMRALEIFIGLAGTPFLLMCWFHPESPKWLITDGQYKEAANILNRVADWNRRTDFVPLVTASSLAKQSSSSSSGSSKQSVGLLSLISFPNLSRNLAVLAVSWFTFGMAYFGLALHTPEFGSNVFLVFFIGGLMDVPVILLGPLLMNRLGRKPCLTGGLLLGGLCLLTTPLVPPGVFFREWPIVSLAIVGKMGMGLAFDVGYVWTTEIFPTVVRNSALAACSSFARAGAIVAPLVSSIDKDNPKVPIIVYGAVSLLAGVLSLLVYPETRSSKHLPDTLEDGEKWARKSASADKYHMFG